MQNQIEQEIQMFIKPFIDLSSLSGAQFPLLSTTYTLWRKVCYKSIVQKYHFEINSQQEKLLKKAFIKISQRKLLPVFYEKIQNQIDGKGVGWRKAILQAEDLKIIDSEQYQQLLLQYCEALYQLQLWIQMFYDLVSIPYTDIYEQNKNYLTNQKFKTAMYSKKNETLVDKACNKIGKNIITKGLGKISETLLSNRVIYGMTGVLGVFNPLASVASMSISYAMESHQKYSKIQGLISELEYLKKQLQKNISQLKQAYGMCLDSIDAMMQLQMDEFIGLERQKRKFKELLGTVLDEDWLQIKSTMKGQWELVELTNKYSIESFDKLSLTSDSSKQNN